MHTLYQGNSPTWKLLPLFCLFGLNSALAQQGKSGAGTISTTNTVVNEYTALTANVAAGSTSISVADNTLNANGRFGANLAPGDLVMLVQMQGASITSTATDNTYGAVTNYNSAGKNELLEVRSVSGANTITFYCGTSNAYTASGHAQVIRIPRYTTLTLNTSASIAATPWNGTIGGVVAIESQGNVTFNSNAAIDVSGQGFRGGALHNGSILPSAGTNYASTSTAYGGEKGESIAGYQADYDALTGRYGRGAAANGGGGGNTHNSGGGGGANVGTGTWTGTGNPNRGTANIFGVFSNDAAWNQESTNFATSSSPGGGRGGYTYSANDQNAGTTPPGNTTWGGDNRKNIGGQGGRPLATTGGLLFLGGGGGAGDENDNVGSAGGNGGGLVYLLVGGNIANATGANNTAIRANGASAGTSVNDAPGGGGGGGTVVLNVAGNIASIGVSAIGGVGGSQNIANNEAEGPGGGGGGGYLLYTTASTAAAPTFTVTGGANGTTNSPALTEFTPNGATIGGSGVINTLSYAAQCAIVADVSAAFTSPTGATTATAGASQSYTVQFANTGPDAASGVTRTVTIPANAASSVTAPGGTITGSQAAGWTITYPGGTVPASATPTSYTFSLIPASTGGTFTLTAASTTSTNQGGNATANDSDTRTLTVNAVTVAGTIFEDVNYGGGAGRPASASGTVGRSGATVEFYDNAGNYVGSTNTGTNGAYSYNLPAAGTYTVRVVNSTVSSSRTGYTTGLLPVQTYNGTTTAVGGLNPAFTDAAANTGSQTLAALRTGTTTTQSVASVTAGSGSTSGVDFGYNFDTVVNTNDSGQGSLRQFITNANALGGEGSLAQAGFYTNPTNLPTGSTATGQAGVALPANVESSIFMIPVGQLTGGVAVITPASALPQITGASTAINGSTQTYNIGNTNDVLLGSGGTVGTQATALGQLNGPEVQLTGSTAVAFGLDVAASATNSRIRGLAIYGFGNNPDNNAAANIRSAANTITIAQNVLGTTATSFGTPPTATNADNVRLTGGTSGVVVSSNLIGFGNSKGISINPGVTNVQVTGNEVRGNGLSGANFDGVDIQGSSATISNNLFTGTSGQGVDSYRSAGSNTITGNTITDNGRGTTTIAPNETPGIRIYGAGNRLSQNVIANNYGAGIMLSGTNATATNTVISQNSIYGNGTVVSRNNTAATGEVGIDLQANGDNEAAGNSPYVTLNSATTNGANGLVNYPIITSAYVSGSSLVVNGYAKSGATIELFTAQPNPTSTNSSTTVLASNFGQGRTYLTTVTEGATTGVTDADTRTGLSYSGAINGFNQGSDTNANGFSFVIPLSSLPGGALAAGTVLTSTATLGGATSEYSGNATLAPLSGYVFEDVNYGGGAGRPRSASGAVGRAGATVELYNASGVLVGSSTTDSNGQYTFGVTAGTYTVRVVNSTVSSSRTGYTAGLLPVQTYNGSTTAVGGANPLFTDAAANTGSQTLAALSSGTTTAQSIATVTTTGATATGPDFGYNFDTVVNTNDSGQGSLRQFITNANALGGEGSLAQAGSNTAGTLPTGRETSIFMIPTGQLTGGVAAITPASALPAITGDNTAIDGTTQTFNIGNTNNVTLGAGGTVGTSATALAQVNGPEVQLKGSNSYNGLSLTANNTVVRGLSLYGFATNIYGGTDKTGTLIEQNVIGASAASFTDPGAGNRTLGEGIDLNGSDNGTVRNNLIGFNGGMGIWVAPSDNDNNNGANNNTITGNEIRGNANTTIAGNGERLVYDGIELLGVSTNNTISSNLITANYGHGIDSNTNTIGGNTISGNTISSNGVGVTTNTGEEGSGIRMYGATNPSLISGNVLSGNNGSGVLVIGSANQVKISQNSTFGNTRLGIDLISETGPTVVYNGNTGTTSNVTVNDTNDADTGGNGLLNFPVITSATVQGGNLVVRGFARPGSAIELFTPSSTPNSVASNAGFGQGQTYLGTFTEGSGADTDNGTGTYSGLINGLNQGTDNTNRFSFTIPLTGNFASYAVGSQLTSTATLNNSTSEFGGNVRVNQAPTANNVTNVAVLTNSAAAVLNPNLSATPNSAGVTIASYTVTDLSNINGTLTYNGTVLTSANIASTLITDLSKLTYKPTLGYTGNATFSYQATDSNGIPSNTATYIIPVSPVADVVAAFPNGTATTVTANGPLSLTVNFTDNGPNDAAGVTRSVQLPAGLGTGVTVTNGGTYNNTTGLVTFTPTPTTLATTGNLNATITIPTVPVGMSSITAVATIATTTSEGGATANNTTATTVAVIPSIDLATTVSGPATFVAGTLATYTVTTSNNGPSAIGTPAEAANGTTAAIPATGAVQTVQLPTGLAGVFATNGGTYNASTGVVTFPDVALASGQVVTNTISFSMPAATSSFSVAATVAKTSTLAGTDTQAANNTASTTTSVTAPSATTTNLYVTATGPAQVAGGSTASYTITQGNYGPVAASNVQTQVSLPIGLTSTTLTLTNNGTAATVSSTTGGVITFSDGSKYTQATGVLVLPALTTQNSAATPQTYVVGVTVPSTTTNPAMNITASVGAATSDVMPANNVATVETEIQPLTDVAIVLTNLSTTSTGAALGGSNLIAGQTASFGIQATNTSTNPARNVQQSVALPSSIDPSTLLLNGATGTLNNGVVTFSNGATYTVSTGTLTLPAIADLMGGAIQTNLLSFTVPAPNSSGVIKLPVAATISTSSPESSTGNNSSSLTNGLASAQDVAVSLSGPTQAVVGNPVLYTVSTTNNGPSANGTQTTTVTLPSALDPTTLRINNVAGSLGTDTNGKTAYVFGSGSTAIYYYPNTNSTYPNAYIVVYPATSLSLPKSGQSAVSTIQFTAPDVTLLNAVANVTTSGTDLNTANNSATVITPLSTSDLASIDLSTTVAASAASGTVGSSDIFTVTTTNGSSTTAASGVTQTLVLPAGLTSNGGTVTTTNGGVYNNQTGVVTFPIGYIAAGASVASSATISLPASPVASTTSPYTLTATGSSFTTNPETNVANNTATTNVTVGSKYDLAAAISGPAAAPAGSTVNYTVDLTNAGPSSATGVTGTFTLPAGVTSYTVAGPTGTPTTVSGSGTVTFRPAANLLTGQSEQWQISFTAPANTFTATASVAATGPVAESDVLPNTASKTTIVNQAPVAYDVVNKAELPVGNTANAMPLTRLNGADTDGGSIANYTITSLPSANAGTLYYNGAAASVGTVVTDPTALTFKPLSTFVGNAFFTYTATDNGNGTAASAQTSAPARYTIPVGQDNASVAMASTQTKGGATPYTTGDVLAYIVDANGAQYTANAGTTPGIVYNAATGVLQSGAANGLASAALVAGAGPAGNTANTLPAGVSLNPTTGQVFVSDASQLVNNQTARTYTVNVTTVDTNGGITTTPVSFTIGAYPLPVELVVFTAKSLQNRDGLLTWTTASELNNDHFEVERSFDGTTYTKVGQVAGQGNKATSTNYSYTDQGVGPKATAGQPVYYRLKQIDISGTSSYSPVRTISFSNAAVVAISLYPNPAVAATSLDLSALPAGNTYQVLLLDATGRQVRQASALGGQVQPLDLQNLATGTYHVLVTGQQAGTGFRQVLRLTKE